MIGSNCTTHVMHPPLLLAYAQELRNAGHKVIQLTPDTFWIRYETASMVRVPTFYSLPPSPDELRSIFKYSHAAVVSYVCEPDARNLANAWLYVARDKAYSIDRLTSTARRDARRALREVSIRTTAPSEILEHGYSAYRDTRARVGLSDGTLERFRSRFKTFASIPSHCFLGAWRNSQLIAFMSLGIVEDWIEIEGSFSTNADRETCPTNGMCHVLLENCLANGNFDTVSYGLSSVQQESNKEGLHHFKQRVGFQAVPVHRAFVANPLIRPAINGLTLGALRIALHLQPEHRAIKKAEGMVALLLGQAATRNVNEKQSNDSNR